jgi:predicted nucleotidyltransferase
MKTLRNATEAATYAAAIVRRHLPDPAYCVFLFGSRAEGTAQPRSDIDIGIEGPAPVPREAMALIEEELEEAPTLYTIEVVDFARVPENFRRVASRRIQL